MAFRKLTDFIQSSVITGLLKDKLFNTMVVSDIVDTQTHATLGKGSSYVVPSVDDLSVSQYDGTDLTIQDAGTGGATISMDKFPVVPYYLEKTDVDESSALPTAVRFSDEAGMQIAQNIDTDVLSGIYAGATNTASGVLGITGSPIDIADSGATTALEYLENWAVTLGEAGVQNNRVVVVPEFLYIKAAKELGVQVNNERIAGQIESAPVLRVFDMDVYKSNNLPSAAASEYTVVGGKRNSYHLILGSDIFDEGDSEKRIAWVYHVGQVYGKGFSNSAAWYQGVITK